ncbi:MAG: serine/threonine-protein kinase [Verrucomicrobiia bacterium]
MDRERLIAEIAKRGIRTSGGQLRIIEELGRGGNGVAFLCKSNGQEVVTKVYIPPDKRDLDEQALKRFQQEVKITEKTRHPNVIRALDSGSLSLGAYNLPFYVMPKASGTLREIILQHVGGENLERKLSLFVRGAFGVAWLHLHGLIHRDLKPENVLIGPDGTPWIADLGIAHVSPDFVSVSLNTIKAERLLNRDYYAPEQRFGEATDVDHRADIYALGCILYELLVGTPPVRNNSPSLQQINEAFAPLDPVVKKMTAYDRNHRYRHLEDALEDLSVSAGWTLATIKGARPLEKQDVPAMVQLLKSSNEAHRSKGVELARGLGKEALNSLHELLGHNRRDIRNAAALALGAIADKVSVPFLVAALYGTSRKPSTFRPSADTAAEALGLYPVAERLHACALVKNAIRLQQVERILSGVAAAEAYAAVVDLNKRGVLLLDYSETGLQLLVKIDEDEALPDVKKLLSTGDDFEVRDIVKVMSPKRQEEIITLWLKRGINDSWHFESVLEVIVESHMESKPKHALLRHLLGEIEGFGRNFARRVELTRRINSALKG